MSLSLDQFRADKTMMRQASELPQMLVWVKIREVLATEHVMHKAQSTGLSPDDKLVRLGQIDGYNKALETLDKIFEEPAQPRKEPQARYEPQK